MDAPTIPGPKQQQMYSINNHGTIAYLNRWENLWLYALSRGAVALVGIAFAVDRWKR